MLIAARAVQGLGAALMTPQTMAVITRTFPPDRRGAAMGLWGATAGVATLVGPLLGGVLVDGLGWEWIFFVNVPVGVIALHRGLAPRPRARRRTRTASTSLGVVLSAARDVPPRVRPPGGRELRLGRRSGVRSRCGASSSPVSSCSACSSCSRPSTKSEPLVPLALFRDRNFSVAQPRDLDDRLHGHEHVAAARSSSTRSPAASPRRSPRSCSSRWPCSPPGSRPWSGGRSTA